MKVGIIGTGVMGNPMAENLLKAGNDVVLYARNPQRVQNLTSLGARMAESPRNLAQESECFLLSLPFDPEVREVVTGVDGILQGVSRGAVIVDTTTGTPQAAREIAAAAGEKGVHYLDAPVSGGVKGAKEGVLTLMIGGAEEAFNKVRDLLPAIGRNIYLVGPVGAGRTLKALNQIIVGLNAMALCEAVVAGKKAGISPEVFLEILGKSAANSYQLQTKLPQFIIPGKFNGGFRIELMLKDLDIGLEMARELRTPMVLTGTATQLYRAAAASGLAGLDTSSLVRFFGSLSGIDFSSDSEVKA